MQRLLRGSQPAPSAGDEELALAAAGTAPAPAAKKNIYDIPDEYDDDGVLIPKTPTVMSGSDPRATAGSGGAAGAGPAATIRTVGAGLGMQVPITSSPGAGAGVGAGAVSAAGAAVVPAAGGAGAMPVAVETASAVSALETTAVAGEPIGSASTEALGAGAGAGAGVRAAAAPQGVAAGDVAAAPQLPTIPLPAKYEGESQRVGWRARQGLPKELPPEREARAAAMSQQNFFVTRYNTPEETAAGTLTPRAEDTAGDTPVRADGTPIKHLTKQGGERATMGRTLYAMGGAGEIVANVDNRVVETTATGQKRATHHSSMLAGAPVAHAGHIGVKEGQVDYLDDDSGHYMPKQENTSAAFNEMSRQGVLDRNSQVGRIHLVDKTTEKLDDNRAKLSVPFAGYSQAGGDEAMLRRRDALKRQMENRGRLLESRQSRTSPDRRPAPGAGVEEEVARDRQAAAPRVAEVAAGSDRQASAVAPREAAIKAAEAARGEARPDLERLSSFDEESLALSLAAAPSEASAQDDSETPDF